MSDTPPDAGEALLDRSPSSFALGGLLRSYATYVLVGLVIAGLAVGGSGFASTLSSSGRDDTDGGPSWPTFPSPDPGNAPMIAAADFRALRLGTPQAAVERKVGKGEDQGFSFGSSADTARERCYAYPLESAAYDPLALLCYLDGRLSTRERQ